MATPGADIEAAWENVVGDCGCPDLYYCPQSHEVECPRHSGFSTCCDRPDLHQPLPPGLRESKPRPPIPREDLEYVLTFRDRLLLPYDTIKLAPRWQLAAGFAPLCLGGAAFAASRNRARLASLFAVAAVGSTLYAVIDLIRDRRDSDDEDDDVLWGVQGRGIRV